MPGLRISLRTALISINLLILVLPIAGVGIMRLYESALVRQTESALIAQGAFVAAFYRSIIDRQGTQDFDNLSTALKLTPIQINTGNWLPRPATLDLATSPVLPPFPDPVPPTDAQLQQSAEAIKLGRYLNPTLKDAQLTTLAGMRVVDVNGTIIASTGGDLGQSIIQTEEISAALNGHSSSQIRTKTDVQTATPLDSLSRTSRIRVFVSLPIIMHERLVGAVLLSRTPPSIVQALYAKRHLLFVATALLLLVVLSMTMLTHRLITRPMNRLVKYAEQIAGNSPTASERLSTGGPPRLAELARLQDAIVAMADTLESRADYLQGFAHHISHEFKTPLTSIRGAVELLQDHQQTMTAEQQQRFSANINADIARLTQLTGRLNELTQAQMRSVNLQTVHLATLITDTVAQFPKLTCHLHGLDTVTCHADPTTLTMVLETLLDNAEQHGANEVRFSWIEGGLCIENDGEPISAGNRDQVFTPFFTTRREQGGSGLGLTIAQTAIQRMGGELSLDRDTTLTRFRIVLTS